MSNHDIDDDGRRFFVADIATHKKGDFKYWDNLYKTCFNNEVGYALYCYFVEVDTVGFKQQNFPITKNKFNSISKRLDTVYAFLKENYILEKKSVDEKLSDFYLLYQEYCLLKNKRGCGKTDFTTKLSEIQINYYKSNGYNKYKISLEQLKLIADNNNWITEIDEYAEEDSHNSIIEDENNEIETLRTENENLKKQLKDMEEKLKLMSSSKPKKAKKPDLTEEELLELEFENKCK